LPTFGAADAPPSRISKIGRALATSICRSWWILIESGLMVASGLIQGAKSRACVDAPSDSADRGDADDVVDPRVETGSFAIERYHLIARLGFEQKTTPPSPVVRS